MTKHFEADQREIRRTLNEPVPPTRSGSSRPPPTKEYLPELPRDGRLPQFEGVQSLVSSLIPPNVVAESTPPRKKLRFLVVAGIIIAVGALAGVLVVQKSTTSNAQAAASVPLPEPRRSADSMERNTRQPSAEFIWLTFSAVPNEAEIRLDGRRISNPYRAAHGRDAVSHHLTVSLDGYQTLEREISFTNDLVLQLSLDHASRGGARRSKAPVAAVRQVEVSPPNAPPAPMPPPAAPAPPAAAPKLAEQKPTALKPGDDLRKVESRTVKARDIDETDPYKR